MLNEYLNVRLAREIDNIVALSVASSRSDSKGRGKDTKKRPVVTTRLLPYHTIRLLIVCTGILYFLHETTKQKIFVLSTVQKCTYDTLRGLVRTSLQTKVESAPFATFRDLLE